MRRADTPVPRLEQDGDLVETMEFVVSLVHPEHRLMFELFAATGARRSELFALELRHLALDGGSPHLRIRQRVRRRQEKGLVIGPVKSRHARRGPPIATTLADRRRRAVAGRGERDLVFRSRVGTVLDPDNVFDRVLRPACSEAGVEWAGFHTSGTPKRSRLFAQGRTIVAVQRWLGHHSPSFTLDTYVHLLDPDLGEPLVLEPASGREKVKVMSGNSRKSPNPWQPANTGKPQ